ncbi:MAG: N-acetylmuramoyl-L-alanine amidase [Deltaproteobacteria bacterium]|nr:MAG: N-acetylmuramoyl-L-alanine amidase [Deltaproteobacteria bacterium]
MSALLLVLAWILPATAGRLTGVRTFTAPGQARILLILDDGAVDDPLTTRATPPMGSIPARGVTWVGGATVGEELPVEIPVDSDGVRRLLVAQVGDGVQITAELDDPREVRAERLDARGVMVDLIARGPVAPDPAADGGHAAGSPVGGGAGEGSLPSRDQLRAVLQGASPTLDLSTPPRSRPVIVLDAGHGGWDHGAVGVTGTREADITLQLVRRTRTALLRRIDADVILTRDSDRFLYLTERARIANNADADVFISIHANAAPGPAAWGIETYSMDTASDKGAARVAARENAIAWEDGGEDGPDLLAAQLITAGTMRLSKELAAEVQAGVCRHLSVVYGADNVRDLGTKTALFTVLTRTRMPAILFESSFVSHPVDERRLRAPHWQQAVAEALADAIVHWLDRQGDAPPPAAGPTPESPPAVTATGSWGGRP